MECGRGARLVVVLEKPGELILVIEPGAKVVADRPDVAGLQPVVEPFVVAIVEALLLQRPFEIPIDLGHESEGRMRAAHRRRRLRPERLRGDPQVRWNTSGSTSIAMSQRTPSHLLAIAINSSICAFCSSGLA